MIRSDLKTESRRLSSVEQQLIEGSSFFLLLIFPLNSTASEFESWAWGE